MAAALSAYRSVRYAAATLEGSGLLCEVIAESTEALFEVTTSGLAQLDGVLGWSAAMEVLVAKRDFVTTPWWETAGRTRRKRQARSLMAWPDRECTTPTATWGAAHLAGRHTWSRAARAHEMFYGWLPPAAAAPHG